MALSLIGIMAVSTKRRAGGINIKALSSIFFVFFLISNLVFTFTTIKLAPYIIINGLLLLIYVVSTLKKQGLKAELGLIGPK